MKKFISITATMFLILALLTGCGNPQTELPTNTQPSGMATEPETDPTTQPNPETAPTTQPTTEPAPTETEGDIWDENDPLSYYTNVVYGQQITRYQTAISQKWDEKAYLEHEMSPLAAGYYEGKPLDNVGFTVMDLDADGIWELIIGAIQNAEQEPLVFEIWTLKNDEPVMLAQSSACDRYYLQHSEEDDLWSVAYEAEKGDATRAVYYLQMLDGKFEVTQGIVFDAVANAQAPWFMSYDLDWDVSNDMPIDEDTANAVMKAGRNIYAAVEYFPYSIYK